MREELASLMALALAALALLANVLRAGSFIARVEAIERIGAEVEGLRRELGRLAQRIAHLEGAIERRANYEDTRG